MEKVKEELLLSLIFVGKWLALGLGVLGILYLAIYLAYHKSYFDPRMDKFDLEISEMEKSITGLNRTKKALESGLQATNREIKTIDETELPRAESEIESAKKAISKLGLKWWEKLPIPMLEKRSDAQQAFKNLEDAKQRKTILIEEKEQLVDKQNQSNASIIGVSADIKNAELDLVEKKRDKEKAAVDVKGPLLWLASILGLT